MADNVRINQATSKMIVGLVAEEAAKKQQREAGLIQITEAAAKAGLGPLSAFAVMTRERNLLMFASKFLMIRH